MTGEKKPPRSHRHEVVIEASPEAVWRAVTDPAELVNWFPLEAGVEPGAGGEIRYRWGDDLDGVCRIEVWEPPGRLRTDWFEEPASAGREGRRRLAVDWTIEGRGGKTVLRLVHSGFGRGAEWDDEYDATNRGWEFELRSLKHYLERHRERARRAFWLRRPVAGMGAEEAWRRMVRPGGFLDTGRLEDLRPGDPYEVTLATGERLEGEVLLLAPPTDFAGTVSNLDDGLWRLGYEVLLGTPELHVWLSTWGLPAAEIEARRESWRQSLEKALA